MTRTRQLCVSFSVGFWILAGCQTAQSIPPAHTGTGQTSVAVERGPKRLEVDGDPNGLWWDAASQTLYIADDNHNRILKWTDAAGFATVRDLPPPAAQGAGLGQLVLMGDGSIVVTRFGHGKAGDVVVVPASGDARIVPGLDPSRRRIGLAVGPQGRLFDAWFENHEPGQRIGTVAELSLDGSETAIISDLKKPVGVLAVGGDLFVSDQDLGQILKAPWDEPAKLSVFASVPAADLLAAGPDGSILSGSRNGHLYRVSATGEVSVLKSGFQQIRGVAYDPRNRRVFVVEHDADASDGVRHAVHVLPLD